MRPLVILLSLLLATMAHAQMAASFIFPSVHCQADSTFCGDQITTQVQAFYQNFPSAPLEKVQARRLLIPQVYSQGTRTPFAFLYVHGLWDAGRQWDSVITSMRSYQQNVVSLVLPGHGLDHVNGDKTTWNDWVTAFNNAFEAAAQMGDKVIVFGQSTGAMVAFQKALQRDSRLAALAFIEPAFGINELYADQTCLAARLVPDAFNVRWLLDAFRLDLSDMAKPLYVQLACELRKLTNEGMGIVEAQSNDNRLKAIYASLQAPIYILSNSKDSVVSRRRLQLFKDNVRAPHLFQEFQQVQNRDGTWMDIPHGQMTKKGFYNRTNLGPRLIEKFLEARFPSLRSQ